MNKITKINEDKLVIYFVKPDYNQISQIIRSSKLKFLIIFIKNNYKRFRINLPNTFTFLNLL